MLHLVEHGIEEQQTRAGRHDLLEPRQALLARSAYRDLLRHLWTAVESPEPFGKSLRGALTVLVDRKVDALADWKRGGIAPRLAQKPMEQFHLVGEFRRRQRPGAHEPLTELDRAPERIRMMSAEPDRWMRLLHGLWLHGDVPERPEVAGDAHTRLGPQALHQANALGEARRTPLGREAKRRVHARISAEADADDEPALAQVIERGQTLGEMHRVVKRREEHGAA